MDDKRQFQACLYSIPKFASKQLKFLRTNNKSLPLFTDSGHSNLGKGLRKTGPLKKQNMSHVWCPATGNPGAEHLGWSFRQEK